MRATASRTMALALVALLALASLVVEAPEGAADETTPPQGPVVSQQEVQDSVLRGLEWAAGQQAADGAWRDSTGETAFALLSFANAGFDHTNRSVQDGIELFRMRYNPEDGSIADSFLNYDTALALAALSAIQAPDTADMIAHVADFMQDLQYNDTPEENMTEDWYWGGWPNYAGIPDISNSQFAILGLMAAEVHNEAELVRPETLERAVTFTHHVQNWPDVNPLPWAHDTSLPSQGDGGFVYNGYRSRTELGEKKFQSYGSITAGGLYMYMATGSDPRQPEVSAVRDWLDYNYNFQVNPNMSISDPMEGKKGLYYYLWTQARVLAMHPQDWVVDSSGKLHDWRAELADYFMDLQLPDGSWPGNPQTGWREEEPELATFYAILCMQTAYMMVPNPQLKLEVEGGTTVTFISQEGEELATDVTRGLTVTDRSLTCTEPEVFRKLWVSIDGSPGSTAEVTATGTWGEGRTSQRAESVELGAGGASVHVASGSFAGPFAIHMTALDNAPRMDAGRSKPITLVRGETAIVTIDLEEMTGGGPLTDVTLITDTGEGIVADVRDQRVVVTPDGQQQLELTITVSEKVKGADGGTLRITSGTAPPITLTLKLEDAEEEGPDTVYWILIVILFVVVAAFFAVPAMGGRGRKGEGQP